MGRTLDVIADLSSVRCNNASVSTLRSVVTILLGFGGVVTKCSSGVHPDVACCHDGPVVRHECSSPELEALARKITR